MFSSTQASTSKAAQKETSNTSRQARFFLPSPTVSTRRPSHNLSRSEMSTHPSPGFQSSTDPDSHPISPGRLSQDLSLRRFQRRRSLHTLQSLSAQASLPSGEIKTPTPDSDEESANDSLAESHEDIRSTLDYRLRKIKDTIDHEARLREEQMEALLEIHGVLYRGGKVRDLKRQSQEMEKVLEKWFEGDCVYDHPLLKIGSRQFLSSHFTLLHLLSSLSLPAPTPSSMIHHLHNVISSLRRRISGEDNLDLEAGLTASVWEKGKRRTDPGKMESRESGTHYFGPPGSPLVEIEKERDEDWVKAWDVTSECLDLGTLESYDGYHLALIDHVIKLTLLPGLLPSHHEPALHSVNSSTSLSTIGESSPSFLHSIASSVAREFDYLLKWDLRIRTFVEFNEVGRITYIRDTIDIQDLIGATVPLARRFGWLAKRFTGVVTSSLGLAASIVLSSSTEPKVVEKSRLATPVVGTGSDEKKEVEVEPSTPKGLGSAIELGASRTPTVGRGEVPAPRVAGYEVGFSVDPLEEGDMAPDTDASVDIESDYETPSSAPFL